MAWSLVAVLLAGGASAGAPPPDVKPRSEDTKGMDTTGMSAIAESYVKLVLAVGQHDANYVDA